MKPAPLSRNPRVLMVLNRYHPMVGGAERQCRQLLARLPSEQVQVAHLVTHRYRADLASEDRVDNIRVTRLGHPQAKAGVAPLSFYVALFFFLIQHARQFDVVHCHTAGFTGLMVAVVGRCLRKPTLLKLTAIGELEQQVRRSHATGWKPRLKSALRRSLARLALSSDNTCLVALTPSGADECREAGARRVTVIPNGVDTAHFSWSSEGDALRTTQGPATIFGYAGRLTSEKGTDTLAAVFRRALGEAAGKIELKIIGSAELQLSPSLELLNALGADFPQQVSIRPPVADTVEFLRSIDCYFSASTYEGLPNAVLEALACQLPCILSDIDAHREVKRLNPDAHIELFDPTQVDTCVMALHRFANMRPRPRSALSSALRLETVVSRYAALYRQLSGNSLQTILP